MKAKSVIDCEPFRSNITAALEKLFSVDFKTDLNQITNPYGEGGASALVIEVLKSHSIDHIAKKVFCDLA